MAFDFYTQNYWNVNLSPGDPGYDSRPWLRPGDSTHPYTIWVGVSGVWKRALPWEGRAGSWEPGFDASEADVGPNTITDSSHCNTPPATTNPPTYGAQVTFHFAGSGTTLQVQVQWTLDAVNIGAVQTFTTGPGYHTDFNTSISSTPTTAGTGVDDGNAHVWTFTWRAQKLDSSWTSWTAAGTSVTTHYQACGRPV